MTGKKKPAKRAKTKKAKATRQPGVLTVDLGANLVPADGVTCGCYIRSLVMMGKSTEEILALVGKHFPKSTAKGSDVSWTRARLRAAGKKLPG